MWTRSLSIERVGRRWAIKHNDGFLGFVTSEAEAWTLIEVLKRGDEPRLVAEAPEPAEPPAPVLIASAA